MRVVSIIPSLTTERTVVFRTDPPLTPQVFEAARQIRSNVTLSYHDGFLGATSSVPFVPASIEVLNRLLEEASLQVQVEFAHAHPQRPEVIREWERKTGLSAEWGS